MPKYGTVSQVLLQLVVARGIVLYITFKRRLVTSINRVYFSTGS